MSGPSTGCRLRPRSSGSRAAYERAFLANVGPLALEAAALARRPRARKQPVPDKRRRRRPVAPQPSPTIPVGGRRRSASPASARFAAAHRRTELVEDAVGSRPASDVCRDAESPSEASRPVSLRDDRAQQLARRTSSPRVDLLRKACVPDRQRVALEVAETPAHQPGAEGARLAVGAPPRPRDPYAAADLRLARDDLHRSAADRRVELGARLPRPQETRSRCRCTHRDGTSASSPSAACLSARGGRFGCSAGRFGNPGLDAAPGALGCRCRPVRLSRLALLARPVRRARLLRRAWLQRIRPLLQIVLPLQAGLTPGCADCSGSDWPAATRAAR